MKLPGFYFFSFICLTTFAKTTAQEEPRVVCYYQSWSISRPGNGKYNPENINPYLCTHLIYAFGNFTLEDNTLQPFNKIQDIENGGYAKFNGLKTANKKLKTMLSIGGWIEGSTRFSSLVGDAEARRTFIKNAIIFLRHNNFDGLDLDWQYPTFRDGGKPTDRENHAQFVQELREEFDRESTTTEMSKLLLTVAIPGSVWSSKQGYDVAKLNQYLDWFNVLTFDYHDSYEPITNHHAQLYQLEEDDELYDDGQVNIDFSVKHLISAGAAPQKLVLGIPTYGRSFKLSNLEATNIGAPADGPGAPGNITQEEGILAYYEICQNIKNDGNWTVIYPKGNVTGPYMYKDDQWIGYDDENMSRKKAQYAANNGLGGIMFWTIDTDDFNGICSGKPYPLIEAAKEGLYGALGIKLPDPKEIIVTTTPQNRPIQTPTVTNEASTKLTPEPPTTPDPGSDFICEGEGFFPHPSDCKKYFWCSVSGSANLGITAHQITCSSDLVFNKQLGACDHAQNVICENMQSSIATTATPQTTPSQTTTRISTTQQTTTLTTTTNRLKTMKSTALEEPRVVCYYTNWSIYRSGNAMYNPENINPYLCTHLIYAFGSFSLENNTLKPFDDYQDIENGGYTKFTSLKTANKNLKTMLAIGGWNEGSTRFSSLVGDAETRRTFIKNAIIFLRYNNFDGLDLDWQHPTFRDGGKPADRENHAQFVQELREEFDRESTITEMSRLLLTIGIPAAVQTIKQGFDVVKLNQYLDWFNVLTFDYHNSYEPITNHHAPLYSLGEDDEFNDDSEINIDFSVKYLISAGADPQKLVLGIPTHGRTFKLLNPEATNIGAPADGPGAPGYATKEEGLLAYFEICQNIKNDGNWTIVHPNDNVVGPYLYKNDQWIGYDDENMSRKKAQYAANNGLGGIMFWTIDTDDFNGICSGKPYPLIEAAKEGLYGALGIKLPDPKEIIVTTTPQNRPIQTPTVSENTQSSTATTATPQSSPSQTTKTNRPTITTTITTSTYDVDDKVNEDQIDDLDHEKVIEDPKVVEELIDLIRKAGGLEKIQKYLEFSEDNSPLYDKDDRKVIKVTPEVTNERYSSKKRRRRPIPQNSRMDNLSIIGKLFKETPRYVTIDKYQTSIKIVW